VNDGALIKRCGCTEPVTLPDGTTTTRQLGSECPKLRRSDGSWNARHGSWGFQIQIPGTRSTVRSHLRQFGHKTSDAAQDALDEVAGLLALADGADDPLTTRVEIADQIRPALAARTALPDADAIRRAVGRGLPVTTDPYTDQYLTGWIETRKDLRENTRRSYTQQIRTDLAPRFARIRLHRLTLIAVQKVFNEIEEEQQVIADQNAQRRTVLEESKAAWREHRTYDARRARALLKEMPPFRRTKGAATIQRYLSCLSSALEDARRTESLGENVAQFVRLTEATHHKPKLWTDERVEHWRQTGETPSPVMVWTAEQTNTFLTRAKDEACGYPFVYYAAFKTIVLLGTRRGETCALPRANINYATGAVDITQQLVQYGWRAEIQYDTKSEDGQRTAMAPKTLLRTLAKLKKLQAEQKLAALEAGQDWTETGLVFTDDDGRPLHPSHLNDALADIAKQCDMPPVRVHDLRHGLATQARSADVEDSVLSGMLGHSSKWFTSAFYGDIADEVKLAASEKIANLFALDDEDD